MLQLRTVAAGLVLTLASFCLNVLSVNVFVGGALVARFTAVAGRGLPANERSFVLHLSAVLSGLALLLDLAGKILCLWTPRKWSAARYLYASLALEVMGLCCLGSSLAAEFVLEQKPLAGLGCLSIPGWAIASLLFLMFLSRLADEIGRRDLARAGSSVLFWSILSGVSATAHFVAFALVDIDIVRLILILPALTTLVIGLVTAVGYAILLIHLRTALLVAGRRPDGQADFDIGDAG
jgi:hypothetical protein